MRIAFDHQIFALQEHGGVSRYHSRLAIELALAGHAVRVVAPFHVNAHLGDLPGTLSPGRLVAPSRWGGRATRVFNRLAGPPLIAAFAPDIVQETYYSARRTSFGRVPVVVPVYDMIHELYPALFPADDPTAARKAAAVARADHVLCISQNTRADLVRFHPAAATKASVTLLGFDAPPPLKPTIAKGWPYLLFVGQRGRYKNWDGLLEAYAAAPALRDAFDLVAVGGGGFSADEAAAIARHGLGAKVWQRPADDTRLQHWYAGAAVFIYPSLYEGFGIPPLEAMAAGTPVVAMRASSIPEVCGAAAAYAEPDDPQSLRRAIEAVVLSPANAAALVAAGTAQLAQFSWARCAAETAAIYRTLL